MPSYKLTYFNIRGRGEWLRLILAQAKVPYEDKRVEFRDWNDTKPTTPFCKLPILTVDGTVLSESKAIASYLASEHGLHGTTNLEKAYAHMISDVIRHAQDASIAFLIEKDETKKNEMVKKFSEETFPTVCEKLETHLKKNGTGWFVGNKVTYADICAFDFFSGFTAKELTLSAEKTPFLAALVDKVKNLPNIAEWLEKRPHTPF
jgi:glutathione S-transferase